MRGAIRQPEVTDRAPVDAAFQHDNRGKRGIAVAVNKPEGADLVRRLAAGADAYVTKPFSPRELAAQVDALLQSAR